MSGSTPREAAKCGARVLGDLLHLPLARWLQKVRIAWDDSALLNCARRTVQPATVRVRYALGVAPRSLVSLHLGCGVRRIEGCINVDWRKTPATDLVCDIRNLPFPPASVASIESYHVIEHFTRDDACAMLQAWRRLLVDGGRMVVECPDFDETVRQYLVSDPDHLVGVYGDVRFRGDVHLYGYNFRRLRAVLEEAGFTAVRELEAQDYHAAKGPCLRAECEAPRGTAA